MVFLDRSDIILIRAEDNPNLIFTFLKVNLLWNCDQYQLQSILTKILFSSLWLLLLSLSSFIFISWIVSLSSLCLYSSCPSSFRPSTVDCDRSPFYLMVHLLAFLFLSPLVIFFIPFLDPILTLWPLCVLGAILSGRYALWPPFSLTAMLSGRRSLWPPCFLAAMLRAAMLLAAKTNNLSYMSVMPYIGYCAHLCLGVREAIIWL